MASWIDIALWPTGTLVGLILLNDARAWSRRRRARRQCGTYQPRYSGEWDA